MGGLFLLILILLPVIEISLFIYVGGMIGPGLTIVLIIASATLGLSIMRRQGVAVVASAQRAQAEGRAPVAEVGNGIAKYCIASVPNGEGACRVGTHEFHESLLAAARGGFSEGLTGIDDLLELIRQVGISESEVQESGTCYFNGADSRGIQR